MTGGIHDSARTTLHNGHADEHSAASTNATASTTAAPSPGCPAGRAGADVAELGTATNHARRRSSPADQCQAATDERGPQTGHPARYRCTRRAQGRLALVSGESARSGRSPNPAAHLAARDHAGRPQARRRRRASRLVRKRSVHSADFPKCRSSASHCICSWHCQLEPT